MTPFQTMTVRAAAGLGLAFLAGVVAIMGNEWRGVAAFIECLLAGFWFFLAGMALAAHEAGPR